MIPNSLFQYQLRGTDMRGNMFEHMSNRLVTSTSPDERITTPLNCPSPQPSPTPSSTPTPSSSPTGHGAATGLTPVVTMCYFVASTAYPHHVICYQLLLDHTLTHILCTHWFVLTECIIGGSEGEPRGAVPPLALPLPPLDSQYYIDTRNWNHSHCIQPQ